MNYLFQITICIWIFLRVNGYHFDRYSGKEVETAEKEELRNKNATEYCTIEVKPCTPHEGSRIDGTCNNYKYPVQGSANGPYSRLLISDYGNSKRDIRRNRKGAPLPSARRVRTALQPTGRVDDKHAFTVAAPHFLEFIGRDVSLLNGSLDFHEKQQSCCQPKGAMDKRCAPIEVPADDPYLKVTDIRCLNFSRAITFQDASCTPETIHLEQINLQTPLLDLSTIYGVDKKSLHTVRTFKHGLLNMEKRDNHNIPLNLSRTKTSTNPNMTSEFGEDVDLLSDNLNWSNVCFQNKSNETLCYRFGFPEAANFDLRTKTIAIFFMREHNRLAKILQNMNPCWKDDRLFKVARQINIATAANIFMYELLPLLLGTRNMQHYNLISEHVAHLTAYDKHAFPLVFAEYEIATRYFHTFLDGRVKRYDEKYNYVGEFPLGETVFRQGLIEQERNFEEINRGTFYQHAAKIDDIVDPEISENYNSKLQQASDLLAIDIQRGRDLGIPGYNNYRQLCGLQAAKKFDDLLDVMDREKVHILKRLYEDINDVDLLAGMSENLVKGIHVGPTLFCIMAKQLQVFRLSDRFWFERGDQFHSFTLPQLQEIRKANMARLACDNAEAIKFIQPQAFLSVRHGNEHVPCTHITALDFSKWTDSKCHTFIATQHGPRFISDQTFNQILGQSGHDSDQAKSHKQGHTRTLTTYWPSIGPSTATKAHSKETLEKQNMNGTVSDYSNFFDSLLSNKDQVKSFTQI